MDQQDEEFERLMQKARLDEAQAKAAKAAEEVLHEQSKRKKTDREADSIDRSKWHDGFKTVAVCGAFLVSVAGLVLKARSGK